MSQKEKKRLIALVAVIWKLYRPGGVAQPEEMDSKMQGLFKWLEDVTTAGELRERNFYINDDFISWITKELKMVYKPCIAEIVTEREAEIVYYNIVLCLMERLQLQDPQTQRTISQKQFCKYIKKDRKTCNNVKYTKKLISALLDTGDCKNHKLSGKEDIDKAKKEKLVTIIDDITNRIKHELKKY